MKKAIIIVALLAVLLLALCLLSVWYMVYSVDQLLDQLPRLLVLIQRGQWDEAEIAYQKLSATFEKIRLRWEALINHDDMRDIEVALVGLGSAIALQDHDEAVMELEEVEFFLNHIAETERIDLGNVL